MYDYAVSLIAFAAAARLALHRGDLNETNRELARAMRSRQACTFVIPWLAVRLRLQLAKVTFAIADATTARHLLREIDDIFLHRPALGALVDEVSELRASSRAERPGGPPAVRRSAPRSCACSRTCRRTSRSRRSRGGCSCRTTPCGPEVGAIYRKLGVSSRSDAVQRATAVGLLGG